MKKPPMFYVLRCFESSYGTRYSHAEIAIYKIPERDYHLSLRPILEIEWQSDSDQSPPAWYCPHASARTEGFSECGFDSDAEHFQAAASFLRRFPLDCQPIPFVARLEAAGIKRRVFDNRLDQYIEPADLMPATEKLWLARVGGNVQVKALASDDDEARRELLREFGKMIASPTWGGSAKHAENLAAWQADGSPVELDGRAQAPTCDPIETLFAPLGKAPAPVAEPAEQVA